MSKNIVVFRNEDIDRVIAFIPPRHKHIRVLIETKDSIFIFQEATIANLVRAYIMVSTHPTLKAVELVKSHLKDKKDGFAEYQLVESKRIEDEIISELSKVIQF